MHGTYSDPDQRHPVVDLQFWRNEIEIKQDEKVPSIWIYGPRQLVQMEWRRAAAFAKAGRQPEGVPVDLFLWGLAFGSPPHPYLTRIGGIPWRESGKPWPKDKDGRPLTFLAQLCFLDSKDVLDKPPPGDVLLIFGHFHHGSVDLEKPVLEWSSSTLKKPAQWKDIPVGCSMPFELHAAIHRTKQYPDDDALFEAFDEHSLCDALWHGTIIGPQAFLPQGGDIEGLIATFGSVIPGGPKLWPLLNVPSLPICITEKGYSHSVGDFWDFNIADVGVIILRQTAQGEVWSEFEF